MQINETTGKPVRVQSKRTKGWRMPANTTYVGRPGRWGNPFAAGKPGPLGCEPIDAEGAVGFFRMMLRDSELRAAAGYPSQDEIRRELRGRNQACWCPLGQPCHADVLLEVANESQILDVGLVDEEEDYHHTLNDDLRCTVAGCPPEFLGCDRAQYSAYVNFLRAISGAGLGGHKCWTKAALDGETWTIEIHFPHCEKAFTRIAPGGSFIIAAIRAETGKQGPFVTTALAKAASDVCRLLEGNHD
jgi:hypothetical protein